MKLTANQLAVLSRVDKGCGYIHESYADRLGRFVYYIPEPYSDEDGRTVRPLIERQALVSIGDRDYALSEEAKLILTNKCPEVEAMMARTEPNDIRLAAVSLHIGSWWRHRLSGGIYMLQAAALDEKDPSKVLAIYGEADGEKRVWARDAEEFFDGRFVALAATDIRVPKNRPSPEGSEK